MKNSIGCGLSAMILAALISVASATERSGPVRYQGVFDVYAQNREDGIPNFVTADLLVVSYSLIRQQVLGEVERRTYAPLLTQLVAGLKSAMAEEPASEVTQANRDYLAVLDALLVGRTQVVDADNQERAQAELDAVLAAQGIRVSPLWQRLMDYSQFVPRGRYAGDPEAEAYFRTMRYAGNVLFAVQDSAATGITPKLANRMISQAVQLANHLRADSEPGTAYRQVNQVLTWQFGSSEDLTLEDLTVVAESVAVNPVEARKKLLERARQHGQQPRIIDAVVDRSGLEPGSTVADVMTGWRLLPSRYRADSAAFQALVYDSTGAYTGNREGAERPFGLTLVNGQAVKGFPLADELLALLGSELAHKRLVEQGETDFEGYSKASAKARSALNTAAGLEALQINLSRVWLEHLPKDQADPLTSLRAFWTLQRHSAVLYAKQSYTVASKGLTQIKPRTGAVLERATGVYAALANMVDAHREHTSHESWEAFAKILERVAKIDAKGPEGLDADDEAYLNRIDRSLIALTKDRDRPIVVDVHTDAASSQVLEEATGMPVVVEAPRPRGELVARGARLSHHEFKQPLDSRLTDEAWRRQLEGGS